MADPVPFQAHVELLQVFLVHRKAIVEGMQSLLNAQRKPVEYLQDRSMLARQIEDRFYGLSAVTPEPSRLRGQLEKAHWDSGFRPRQVPGLFSDLIHPAEMMIRGFHFWRQTRWPGRNGRVRYAHTLFDLYLIRCLQLLSMRVWDAGPARAGKRLAQIQALLDTVWNSSPADLPALVRDARWLIPLAQSPTTDDLAGYFVVAEQVAETLVQEDRIEIVKAHMMMIAGHLRSQMRHYCIKDGLSLDDHSVVLRTRMSNALDFALLVQGLVPLLEAYEQAIHRGDDRHRFELADAICQSISPDPELFLNRVELLGPYSMIEELFIATDRDGRVTYSPMGLRHLQLIREYESLIGRMASSLNDDFPNFRPVDDHYSPYGAIFGTPTNLIEDMALKTLEREAESRFGLEDVFTDGDADKLAWVSGWRQLPHIDTDVRKLYEYPRRFATEVFERIEVALSDCVSESKSSDATRAGRLYIVSEGDAQADSNSSAVPELPVRYCGSSDRQIVAAQMAEALDQTRLLHGRQEGYYSLSYEASGGWVAIRKDFLTEILGAGRDARIVGLPNEAARVLRLMCPGLVSSEAGPG